MGGYKGVGLYLQSIRLASRRRGQDLASNRFHGNEELFGHRDSGKSDPPDWSNKTVILAFLHFSFRPGRIKT